MESLSVLTLLIPLVSLTASPGSGSIAAPKVESVAFGRVIEVVTSRGREEQLHANRWRLNDSVSLGGVFNLFDVSEKPSYTLNIRVTF